MRNIWILPLLVIVAVVIGYFSRNTHRDNNQAGRNAQPSQTVTVDNISIYNNIVYKVVDGQNLLLDVYTPQGSKTYPAVIAIHGGGFSHKDKSEWTDISSRLAKEGFVVFNINYRLSPPGGTWHYPAHVEDVHSAASWVRENGAKYNASVSKIGSIGGSAGANLSMMLATTGTSGQDKVDVAIAWSAPTAFDLPEDDVNKISVQVKKHRETDTYPNVASYLNCTVAQLLAINCDKNATKGASPAYQVTPDDSPILIVNSTLELVPLNQAKFMADQMKKAGVPYQLRVVPGSRHAQGYADVVWNQSVTFLHTYLDK